MQGVWVQSLVGELDPMPQRKSSHAATKTQCSQMNKYFLKNLFWIKVIPLTGPAQRPSQQPCLAKCWEISSPKDQARMRLTQNSGGVHGDPPSHPDSLLPQNSDTCYNMDKPWGHHAKWNKPVTEGQILCDSSSVRSLCVHACVLACSVAQSCPIVACQAPLSMGFPRQKY